MTSLKDVLLGFVLGLFGPIIHDLYRRYQDGKTAKQGILTELKELRLLLAYAAYLLKKSHGTFDRELLEWCKLTIENYSGVYISDNLAKDGFLKSIKTFLELSDEQIEAYTQQNPPDYTGHGVKKYDTPFLNSNINYLTTFDKTFQNKIFNIKTQLSILHEEIDNARFYFRKTFDSLEEPNDQIIRDNLNDSYNHIARMARRLADRIGDLGIE